MTTDIIKGVVQDIRSKKAIAYISRKFHNTVSMMILRISNLNRRKTRTVVLSGGVFLNKIVVSKTNELLGEHGFRVYGQDKITSTDSGIPLGQVALCA